jgi:hypothetical protein
LNSKYNYQEEINKTPTEIFKEYGMSGAIKSGVFVICWYAFNYFFLDQYQTSIPTLIIGYLLFCIYFTFKPKIISYLKGYRKDNGK